MTDDPRDAEPHAPEAKVHHEPRDAHVPDAEGAGGTHVDEHTSDDHGHGDVRLGSVDWGAWGYALVGVIGGLLVVLAFWLAIA